MFRYWTCLLAIALTTVGLSGCLYEETKTNVPQPSRISTHTLTDGLRISEVEASPDWVYWDLDEGRELNRTDLETDSDWDLAIRGRQFKANNTLRAWALDAPVDFDAVTEAPTELEKLEQGTPWDAFEEGEDGVPREFIYFVRTTQGKELKLQVLDYYGPDGTEAVWTVEWKLLNEVLRR